MHSAILIAPRRGVPFFRTSPIRKTIEPGAQTHEIFIRSTINHLPRSIVFETNFLFKLDLCGGKVKMSKRFADDAFVRCFLHNHRKLSHCF